MADTGPPFPLPPPPTGIGVGFQVGVSPIGTPTPFDAFQTLLSQYANSPVLLQLAANFAQYLDQTANFDLFFDNIWSVDTAQGYGLDVWGRIVGVSRVLAIQAPSTNFGFSGPDGNSGDSFDTAPFFNGVAVTTNFTLSDSAFRTLIFAKALSNISTGSIPAINQLLLNLFPGRGQAYVQDLGNMQLAYTFAFVLSPAEQAIVTSSGVLPKPLGVQATIQIVGPPAFIPPPPSVLSWLVPLSEPVRRRSHMVPLYVKPVTGTRGA